MTIKIFKEIVRFLKMVRKFFILSLHIGRWETFPKLLFIVFSSWIFPMRYVYELRIKLPNIGKRKIFIREKSDIYLLVGMFLDRTYSLPNISEAKEIVDLGSHIGISVLFFASHYPNSRIVAVEANPENFKLLQKNVVGLQKVNCINAAVSHSNEKLKFYIGDHSQISSVVAQTSSQKFVEVTGILLDDLITTDTALLKFDVEGSEYVVFQKSKKFPSIPAMVGELHHDLIETFGATPLDFYDLLKTSGFTLREELNGAQRSILYCLHESLSQK